MTTKKTLTKKVRQRHSPAFKEEALALAAKVGVSVAAQQQPRLYFDRPRQDRLGERKPSKRGAT
jgi:transposase-like protein